MNGRSNESDADGVDARELRWAAGEILSLIRQTDHGSIIGMILKQTLHELTSLKPLADGSIIAEYRTRMVA